MSTLYIDGDACPVIDESIVLAQMYGVEVIIVCDTSHAYSFDDEHVHVYIADKGRDAADFLLLRYLKPNDILITQDYGLAALALSKQAIVLSQNGFAYTQETIDGMLTQRHESYKARKQGHHTHIKKRSKADQIAFCQLLMSYLSKQEHKHE